MWFIQNIIQALQNLRSNKMRAFLSILWLVIWVFSVTVLFSVGEWLKDQVLWEFEAATTNTITVVAWKSFNPFNPQRQTEIPWFTDSDISFFADSMGFVTKITPIAEIFETVMIKWEKMSDVRIIAWSKEYMGIEWLKLVVGRWLNDYDLKNYSNVTVMSENTVEAYFWVSPSEVLGKEILIADQYFTIVWVTEPQWWWLVDIKTTLIPITTAQQKITSNPFYPYIVFEIDDSILSSEAVKLVKYTLLKWQWASHMDDALFQVLSTEVMMEQILTVTGMLQLALWGIWAISLLVWGIGVMNIMLVSVSERTREIGIRKAIWARHKDIMMQFLTESIVLGLFGCAIWVLFSWWVIVWLQKFNVPALLNFNTLMVAVLFSGGTGVIFGVWPARKAAKMKPIDALRFE